MNAERGLRQGEHNSTKTSNINNIKGQGPVRGKNGLTPKMTQIGFFYRQTYTYLISTLFIGVTSVWLSWQPHN